MWAGLCETDLCENLKCKTTVVLSDCMFLVRIGTSCAFIFRSASQLLLSSARTERSSCFFCKMRPSNKVRRPSKHSFISKTWCFLHRWQRENEQNHWDQCGVLDVWMSHWMAAGNPHQGFVFKPLSLRPRDEWKRWFAVSGISYRWLVLKNHILTLVLSDVCLRCFLYCNFWCTVTVQNSIFYWS